MKVRMKTRMCGPVMSAEPGQVIDVDAETAQQLLAGGYAEAVREMQIEFAEVKPVERAVTRETTRRGKKQP